jgi:hypothetical protein
MGGASAPIFPACLLPPGYFSNRLYDNQMGTKFWKMVCDEYGVGGNGEFFGDNDSHLGRINVFYHDALGGRSCPARCFSTSSPDRDRFRAVTLRRRLASSSAQTPRETYARAKTGPKASTKGLITNFF